MAKTEILGGLSVNIRPLYNNSVVMKTILRVRFRSSPYHYMVAKTFVDTLMGGDRRGHSHTSLIWLGKNTFCSSQNRWLIAAMFANICDYKTVSSKYNLVDGD